MPYCRAASLLLVPLLLSACAVSSISNPFKSSDEALQPLPPLPSSQNGMLDRAKADSLHDGLGNRRRQSALSASGGLAA